MVVNFLVLLWVNQGVFFPSALLPVLLTLFSCCLSIRLICYVLFVPIFCSKLVLFSSHPVVGMFSYILPQLAGRIFFFFRCFWNVQFCLYCFILDIFFVCPDSWGCGIHRLHLCSGLRPPYNVCPRYDTKKSNGEDPVMPELWRILSPLSLPLLQGPLWPGVEAPDRVLSMGQIEQKMCTYAKPNYFWNKLTFDWIVWNRTVHLYKNTIAILLFIIDFIIDP